MRSHLNLYSLLLIFTVFSSWSQNTVFITSDVSKKDPEDSRIKSITFAQFALGIPLSANPRRGELDPNIGENESWLIPDGLSAHIGYGIHLKKWLGLSANTGIDWRIKDKLFSAPVYAALTLNPHFNKESSLFLQTGIGRAFALGRGNLSGTYQKYRAGVLIDEEILIYIDASLFGYPLQDVQETGSFTIGIALLNF